MDKTYRDDSITRHGMYEFYKTRAARFVKPKPIEEYFEVLDKCEIYFLKNFLKRKCPMTIEGLKSLEIGPTGERASHVRISMYLNELIQLGIVEETHRPDAVDEFTVCDKQRAEKFIASSEVVWETNKIVS